MSIRIGINGFGRIGRNVFRAIDLDPAFSDVEIVMLNDLTDNKTLGHLLKYDSIMGVYSRQVSANDEGLQVDGRAVRISSHRNPADIPWGDMGVDYVIESTGRFTDADSAGAHLDGGAKKVVISAPAKGNVKTIVMGVNEHEYDRTLHPLQRLLHHQLSGAGGQGYPRPLRHQARPDDHRARLHQRPVPA